MDKRRFNRGTKGHKGGTGRPKLLPEERKARASHAIRAHPWEWELISRFTKAIRKDILRGQYYLDLLERELS